MLDSWSVKKLGTTCAPDDSLTASGSSPAQLREVRPTAKPRVLVAEDNPVNQRVATLMLQKLGWQVVTAGDGRQAVEAFEREEFDLVLMDIQMPEMDGFDAMRQIRAWEAQSARRATPIVALTAHAMTGDRERCLRAGMDEYLSKPLKLEMLRRLLQDLGERLGSVAWAALLCLICSTTAWAQPSPASEVGDPVIRNFAPTEYEASGQNWSFQQDARGMLLASPSPPRVRPT